MGLGIHVVTEVALALEMTIAFPTVMVNATVCVVLSQRAVTRKVEIAVIAWPVGSGISFVLLEGAIVWEELFAAKTIGHYVVVVRSEEVTSRGTTIAEFKGIPRDRSMPFVRGEALVRKYPPLMLADSS